MMERDRPVQVYTTPEFESKLEDAAEEEGLSVSRFCEQILRQQIQEQQQEQKDWKYHTGERIEVVFDQLQRDITETLESVQADLDGDIENLQSLRTMYVVSLWELLKDDYGLPQQKAAMKAAGDRLDDSKDTESTTENASADHSDGAVSTD